MYRDFLHGGNFFGGESVGQMVEKCGIIHLTRVDRIAVLLVPKKPFVSTASAYPSQWTDKQETNGFLCDKDDRVYITDGRYGLLQNRIHGLPYRK